jgi:hypothetical protein
MKFVPKLYYFLRPYNVYCCGEFYSEIHSFFYYLSRAQNGSLENDSRKNFKFTICLRINIES